MKKFLSVLLMILTISVAFSACISKSMSPKEEVENQTEWQSTVDPITDSESLEPESDYTIEDLQNAVIAVLREKNPVNIQKYLLPESDSAIQYAYQNFDEDTSALVDLEVDSLNKIFEKSAQEDIAFGDSAEYKVRNLLVLSETSGEENEELTFILQDIKTCLEKIHCPYEITDLAIFEVAVSDVEYSIGITPIIVCTQNGWFIFGFDA